jgi:hypothetical protein
MIAALRDHLSLERRSLTEIATALSVTAMVGATPYNLVSSHRLCGASSPC